MLYHSHHTYKACTEMPYFVKFQKNNWALSARTCLSYLKEQLEVHSWLGSQATLSVLHKAETRRPTESALTL
jgi:hypothetical protein